MILSTRAKRKGELEIFCAFPAGVSQKVFNDAALIKRRAINVRAFVVVERERTEARGRRRRRGAFFRFFSSEKRKKRDAGASKVERPAL